MAEPLPGLGDEGRANIRVEIAEVVGRQAVDHAGGRATGARADLHDLEAPDARAFGSGLGHGLCQHAIENRGRRAVAIKTFGLVGRSGREQQVHRLPFADERRGKARGDARCHRGHGRGPRWRRARQRREFLDSIDGGLEGGDPPACAVGFQDSGLAENLQQAAKQPAMADGDAQLRGQVLCLGAVADLRRPAQFVQGSQDDRGRERFDAGKRGLMGLECDGFSQARRLGDRQFSEARDIRRRRARDRPRAIRRCRSSAPDRASRAAASAARLTRTKRTPVRAAANAPISSKMAMSAR